MKLPKKSKIEWTHYTGGPWLGCSEVSPGCLHCYARTLMLLWFASIVRKAYKAAGFPDWKTRPVWGNKAPRVITKGFAAKARSLNAKAAKEGTRYRMFPSMIDWLDDMPAGIIDQEGNHLDPISVLADFLKLIHDTPNLDWLLLTKRPENFGRVEKALEFNLNERKASEVGEATRFMLDWVEGKAPANVWIGASAEDQPRAEERIPELLKIPARIRFLSIEPMLGPIHLDKIKDDELGANWNVLQMGIHWVIFGGESGPGARHCRVDWIRDGISQCRNAGIAPFVKQLGANIIGDEMDKFVTRIKDPKGGDMSEWSEDIRIREFPTP
jgi:protein gp37